MKKIIALLFLLILLVAAGAAYYGYELLYGDAVKDAPNADKHELFIATGATYVQVLDSLKKKKVLKSVWAFNEIAQRMNYPNKIYPGRYFVPNNMSNRALVQLLRSGKQTPYRFTINNIRTKGQLISHVSQVLETDSVELTALLNDTMYLENKGFTPNNIVSAFMSDTYEFNWNTNAKQFVERMLKEYKRFWNKAREQQAKARNLTTLQLVTLASIVEEETAKMDEMPKVAGVYYNRLKKDWPLQADPTVKFAVGDFTIKRILLKHLEIDSPYNTYKNIGLPPGPIRIPSKKAIEAVLQPTQHKYMYFCAKEDFSGYHNFATTLAQHNINAKKYQRELNRRKIK